MRNDPKRYGIGKLTTAIVLMAMGSPAPARAQAQVYSIYEIQYTTQPSGDSLLEGQMVDCLGGIVTHKFAGFRPKLTLQDPNHPGGWAAIQVKDWLNGAPLFHSVAVGDCITLSNVYVEEFRGNTTLQCFAENNPNLTVLSRGNEVPEPLDVTVAEIASPLGDDFNGWYVATHDAEKYEHMRLGISRVVVGEMNLGKAADNYVLESSQDSNDATARCWAADYMNVDAVDGYHPYVLTGRRFCRVEGILEQYTNLREGWDYYQLVTTAARAFVASQIGDLDNDCDVDFLDFRFFAANWLADCSMAPRACSDSDLNETGSVGIDDLAVLASRWLEGQFTMVRGDDDEQ